MLKLFISFKAVPKFVVGDNFLFHTASPSPLPSRHADSCTLTAPKLCLHLLPPLDKLILNHPHPLTLPLSPPPSHPHEELGAVHHSPPPAAASRTAFLEQPLYVSDKTWRFIWKMIWHRTEKSVVLKIHNTAGIKGVVCQLSSILLKSVQSHRRKQASSHIKQINKLFFSCCIIVFYPKTLWQVNQVSTQFSRSWDSCNSNHFTAAILNYTSNWLTEFMLRHRKLPLYKSKMTWREPMPIVSSRVADFILDSVSFYPCLLVASWSPSGRHAAE